MPCFRCQRYFADQVPNDHHIRIRLTASNSQPSGKYWVAVKELTPKLP